MKASAIQEPKRPRFTFHQILEGLEGVAIMIACYMTLFLKPIRDRWGLNKKEANRPLPGDEIIAEPKTQFTHAITINAPADCVWPWIAQIGQSRGGFYSYEALENIAGLSIYNSDEILPEFQQPKIGDIIPFSPKGGYPVVICEPGKAMAIENCDDLTTGKSYDPKMGTPEKYLHLSWLWFVEDLGNNHSRFISRNRVARDNSFKSKLLFGPMVEPIVFVMDRKMCLGIKKRAEKMYQSRSNV